VDYHLPVLFNGFILAIHLVSHSLLFSNVILVVVVIVLLCCYAVVCCLLIADERLCMSQRA